jgi:prepilin-type N-terminal cleavage/methylation domain-containing protein
MDRNRSRAGFTLLEVVITLIVAAILGTVFVQFMATFVAGSVHSVTRVQNAGSINQVMENMTADFRKLTATDSDFLSTFQTHVQNGNSSGATRYFGPCTVLHNGTVSFDSNGNETAGGTMILKVTIGLGDQRLTALFSK